MLKASDYYQTGNLPDALKAAADEVKARPADTGPRWFLTELLCYAGDLDRADKQLEALFAQDPKAAMNVSLFRQLLRAERSRQEFFIQGHVPLFIDQPSADQTLCLEASIAIREGRTADSVRLLEMAEAARVHVSGTCDDQPFADFRDCDDLMAGTLELLTSNGTYYWIPFTRVETIEFHKLEQPRDLLWRPARVSVAGGPTGEVYLPAIYAGSLEKGDDRARLGRITDWSGGDGTPVRGIGLRTWLVGDAGKTILETTEVRFTAS
jgi:type VI secretion system protein ImpE